MAMIKGRVHLDREVVSRVVSVNGDSPFRFEATSKRWVSKEHPEQVAQLQSLAQFLGKVESQHPSSKKKRA